MPHVVPCGEELGGILLCVQLQGAAGLFGSVSVAITDLIFSRSFAIIVCNVVDDKESMNN